MAETQKKDDKLFRPNLVIGLTEPFGSGCGEMRKVLESDGFKSFKISDDIRGELGKKVIKKGNKDWRKVLQDHGDSQRKNNLAYWIEKVANRIKEAAIGDENIVIDGFRNFKEVEEIRKIYPRFFLVAICAEKQKRWSRVQNDYEGRHDEFERDDRRDRSDDFDWGQSVQKCVDDADYVYYNNENITVNQKVKDLPNLEKIGRTLKEQAKDFVPFMQRTACRLPNSKEVQIASAYAQSHSSTCEKRHVGAVITIERNGDEFPVSMGFNENPPNTRKCSTAGSCYKDEDMAGKLGAQTNIRCPKCGEKHSKIVKPWKCKCGESFKEWMHPNRNMELCTAIHAEERAILSLGDRSAKGGTLYVTTFPCFQCARMILDAEISKIVYVEAYPVNETTQFLVTNKVEVEPFTGFTARAFFRVFPKVN